MTTPHELLSLKIAELNESIISVHPSMPTLLREIHGNLKQDPELTALLSPAEVAIIIAGLSKQTQTTITTSILSGTKGKSLKQISIDDI